MTSKWLYILEYGQWLVRYRARNNGMHCRRQHRKHSCTILKPVKSVKTRRDCRTQRACAEACLGHGGLGVMKQRAATNMEFTLQLSPVKHLLCLSWPLRKITNYISFIPNQIFHQSKFPPQRTHKLLKCTKFY